MSGNNICYILIENFNRFDNAELFDAWGATRYIERMIKKIRHKGLRTLYEKNQTRGINTEWIPRIRRILSLLEAANEPAGLDISGFELHPLKGNYKGFWAVKVTGNWRIVWRFEQGDATDVDLVDYH